MSTLTLDPEHGNFVGFVQGGGPAGNLCCSELGFAAHFHLVLHVGHFSHCAWCRQSFYPDLVRSCLGE